MSKIVLKICLVLLLSVIIDGLENFDEQLLLEPLNDGQQIAASFHFRTFVSTRNLSQAYDSSVHHDIFPLSLFKLFRQHQVQELHLSLSKGVWKYDQWGIPIRDVPSNAHLWAWFTSNVNASENWAKLTRHLSGQFCASINLIDRTVTLAPKLSHRPFLTSSRVQNPQGYLAALPQEAICTENLTPWIKLLPCRSKSGLAMLLQATKIFNSRFFSMSLDFKYSCSDISKCPETTGIELIQSIVIVFNPPFLIDGKYSWSLNSLFGSTIQAQCSLSGESHVYLDITGLPGDSKLTTNPTRYVLFQDGLMKSSLNNTSDAGKKYADYDVNAILSEPSVKYLNLGIQHKNNFNPSETLKPSFTPDVSVRRHARGYGVNSNGIIVSIVNSLSVDIYAIYTDMIPWYLRMYVHTMKIRLYKIGSIEWKPVEPSQLYYEPAQDRVRPHHIELLFSVPAKSKIEIRFEFEQQFLRWTEYPPDANHGLYINPASVTFFFPTSQQNYTERFLHQLLPDGQDLVDSREKLRLLEQHYPLRLYTEPILLSMPTPDFSMPYNVLCLVCTVLSIAFGPIYNLTTRSTRIIEKLYRKSEEPEKKKRKRFLLF